MAGIDILSWDLAREADSWPGWEKKNRRTVNYSVSQSDKQIDQQSREKTVDRKPANGRDRSVTLRCNQIEKQAGSHLFHQLDKQTEKQTDEQDSRRKWQG